MPDAGTAGRRAAPRRVLVLSSSASLYGSDRAMVDLVLGLVALGHDVHVVAPESGLALDQLATAGVGGTVAPLGLLRRQRGWGHLARLLTERRERVTHLAAVARRFAPDVVYANTSHVVDAAPLARRLGVPSAVHLREIERAPRAALLARGAQLRWSHDAIVAISDAVATSYFTRSSPKVHVVHDGIALEPFASLPPPAAGTPLTMVLPGRLTPWKGQHVAIEALRRLRPQVPVRLRIVGSAVEPGDRAYRAELEEAAAAVDGEACVEIADATPDQAGRYRDAHVVLHTSVKPEPFGRTVLEGMAARRYVIAAAAGGPLEVVDDGRTGRLVPPDDPDALAAALRWAVDHRAELPAFGDRAAEVVMRRFSADAAAAGVADVIESLTSMT